MEVIVCICILRILNHLYLFYIFYKYFSLQIVVFHCLLAIITFRWVMRVFPFFDARYCAAMACRNRNIFLQIYTEISSKLHLFHERQNCSSRICFWLTVEFFCNFIYLLYFVDSWRYWGKPGPKKNCSTNFYFCHWNLNGLSAHNYIKLSSLQAYYSVYKHDAICLSETYLDNSVVSDESDLNFLSYKLVRADYPGVL